jgi:hypothetical protein
VASVWANAGGTECTPGKGHQNAHFSRKGW